MSNFLSITLNTMKNIKPIHSKQAQKATGATIDLSNWFAMIGAIHITANTPNLAIAISKPIARAISFPLNHFAIDFETVVPAISQPQPNIMKPKQAILALPGMVIHHEFNQLQNAVA